MGKQTKVLIDDLQKEITSLKQQLAQSSLLTTAVPALPYDGEIVPFICYDDGCPCNRHEEDFVKAGLGHIVEAIEAYKLSVQAYYDGLKADEGCLGDILAGYLRYLERRAWRWHDAKGVR